MTRRCHTTRVLCTSTYHAGACSPFCDIVPRRRVKEDLEVPSSRTRASSSMFVTVPGALKTDPVHGAPKTDPCDQRQDKLPLVISAGHRVLDRDAQQRGYSYHVCIRLELNTTAYSMTRSFLISHFSNSALLRAHSRKSERVSLQINIVSQRWGSDF